MSEEKIKCSKCGTENNANDSFCAECGKSLNNKQQGNCVLNVVKSLFITIGELFSFLLTAVVISAIIAIPFAFVILQLGDSINSENVFQQIYNSVNMTSAALGAGVGVIVGLIITAVIRNTAQLNRIEKKIFEIQNSNKNKE